MIISLGRRLPGASSGRTREHHAGRASPALASRIALLFGLAPGGVYRADLVTQAAGELLPHRFTLARSLATPGGLLSVALSFALPRLAVSQHPALWSSDFPRPRGDATTWLSPLSSLAHAYFYQFRSEGASRRDPHRAITRELVIGPRNGREARAARPRVWRGRFRRRALRSRAGRSLRSARGGRDARGRSGSRPEGGRRRP